MPRSTSGTIVVYGLLTAVGFACGALYGWSHPDAFKLELAEAPQRQGSTLAVESAGDALQAEQLAVLGYVEGLPDEDLARAGVLLHEPAAWQGLNFYNSSSAAEAFLFDMDGKVVHSWKLNSDPWYHATLLDDGGLVANIRFEGIVRLSRDSDVLWTWSGVAHHALDVAEDGTIYAITGPTARIPSVHETLDVVDDTIVVLSKDGEEQSRISLLQVLQKSPYRALLPAVSHMTKASTALDILHTNHVEVFDGRLADRGPLYAKGNLMVSMAHLNAVMILSGETHEVLWLWGPTNVTYQHHPSLLDDGSILLFDNGRKRSRVLEVDPLTNQIRWQYTDPDFFTATQGSAQRLQNGNTLITESNTGHVFEVTRDGKMVWAWANPDRTDTIRRGIWRMRRVAADAQRVD